MRHVNLSLTFLNHVLARLLAADGSCHSLLLNIRDGIESCAVMLITDAAAVENSAKELILHFSSLSSSSFPSQQMIVIFLLLSSDVCDKVDKGAADIWMEKMRVFTTVKTVLFTSIPQLCLAILLAPSLPSPHAREREVKGFPLCSIFHMMRLSASNTSNIIHLLSGLTLLLRSHEIPLVGLRELLLPLCSWIFQLQDYQLHEDITSLSCIGWKEGIPALTSAMIDALNISMCPSSEVLLATAHLNFVSHSCPESILALVNLYTNKTEASQMPLLSLVESLDCSLAIRAKCFQALVTCRSLHSACLDWDSILPVHISTRLLLRGKTVAYKGKCICLQLSLSISLSSLM